MKKKSYFVILYQSELDRLDSEAQIAVYRSIKSFSSNGKKEVALSSRNIASRTKISYVYVIKVLRELTVKGVIKITGKEKRLGGTVNIYKVVTGLTVFTGESVNTVNSLKNKVLTTGNKVLTTDSESVNYTGVKSYKVKSKKVSTKNSQNSFTPCTIGELYKISTDLNIKLGDVVNKHREIIELSESGEMKSRYPKNKSTYFTLRQWLRMAIENGRLSTMSETERIKNEFEEPTKKAKFDEAVAKQIKEGKL